MENFKITRLLSFLGFCLFLVLLVGSASQKKLVLPPADPLKVGTYSFTPPFVDSAKSAGIAFALVNPRYAETFRWSGVNLFKKFSDAMGTDFEALIVARGYSIRGPYNTFDEMIYSDKIETDLAFIPEIELNVDSKNAHWFEHKFTKAHYPQAITIINYYLKGEFIIDGKINLIASEPQTQEKLWIKSIPLPQQTISISSTREYDSQDMNIAFSDPGINNPIVTVLEAYYKTIMQTTWNHLDPNEMKSLKPQVDKIRANKKY